MPRLRDQQSYTARNERGVELAFVTEGLLGEGPHGGLWRARLTAGGPGAGRAIAVKELAPESDELLARFANEASLRLETTPGCPAAYEGLVEPIFLGSAVAEGGARVEVFLTELVEGPPLAQVLSAEGRLPEGRATALAARVAAGLAVAHANNVVHRDLKPANVLLPVDGPVKVSDLGVACLLSKEGLTKRGLSPGSSHWYLAPEQVRDAPGIDCRADVYALGAVLYHALTGAPPFAGKNPAELYRAILRDEPAPLAARGAAVAPELQRLIQRMLAKEPAARPQGMREVLALLPAWVPGRRLRMARLPLAPCVQCGESNPLDGRFCRCCGRDLRLGCGACEAPLRPSDQYCRSCGVRVTTVSTPPVLVGLKGGLAGTRVPLDRDLLRLGRHGDNDLGFGGLDKYVSRFQARLFREGGRYWLEGWNWVQGCATTNGTFVNGVNVDGRGRVLLRSGDRVRLGDSFFRFEA